jgi:hopanoid biosynthesis associated protein HpnK
MDAVRVKRLIVNADDFGCSRAVNQAVIKAHREGILTTASLMVNGAASEEAAALAREHPQLGVGLHLTLLGGRSALKPTDIPRLVDARYRFSPRPVWTGLRYFFLPGLRSQLRREISAQFAKFRLTGLRLDHVNGHLNIHLHPTIFSLLDHHAREWGFVSFRLTRDPFWLNARLAGGRWLYRLSHAVIFTLLSRRARPVLDDLRIHYTDRVFGLLQTGRVDERYLERLLPRLPDGDSELYAHPSLDDTRAELEALTSPRIQALVRQHDIQLIRYQDL